MGFLSKVWKGLKKGVKKIGKKIKKTFKSVMKGIGKLGIVGQIGMMFLMPYAMGAVGSLFGTAGKLATWSTKLLGPNANFFQKVLGKTLEAVNVGGTWIKNAYTSVSTAITNGMDRVGNFFKGKGFTLSEGNTSVFSKDFSSSLDTLPTGENVKQFNIEQAEAAKRANIAEQLSESIPRAVEQSTSGLTLKDGKIQLESTFKPGEVRIPEFGKTGELTRGMGLELETNELFKNVAATDKQMAEVMALGKDAISDIAAGSDALSKQAQSLLSPKDQSFFEKINIFDKDSAIRKDIAKFDLYDTAKLEITEGLMSGLESRAYEAVGVDMNPNVTYNTIRIPNIMGIGSSPTISLGEINQFSAPRGNSWQATNMYSTGILNDILNRDAGQDWRNWMNSFALQNSTNPAGASGSGLPAY